MNSELEILFKKQVEWVNTHKLDISNDEKLKCYGYYKQAVCGNNIDKQPWSIEYEKKAKWVAWESNKGMSKDEAMKSYIISIKDIINKYNLK
tara:strand:+ start:1260 stop:1535 length:276 start_codon:yes stop_codon:yes gene_type:complete